MRWCRTCYTFVLALVLALSVGVPASSATTITILDVPVLAVDSPDLGVLEIVATVNALTMCEMPQLACVDADRITKSVASSTESRRQRTPTREVPFHRLN